ncbi:exo-alpha-sialidase [Staphylococcus sp. GDH8C126P]|uniref:sialidase family protein n=1 Tax=Staphylococcus sp. GDH8C126P TaxID=2804089 RepID=UPI001AEBF1A7|nr:exo-alpha-sialidase [Staphylococcus sp. GDH8C126P]
MENNSNIEYKPIFEKNNVVLKNESLDITDELNQIFVSEDSAIIIKFKSNNKNALQALFGISNKDEGFENNYFDIFIRNDGGLGAEIRDNNEDINHLISRPASLWGKNQEGQVSNIIAFVSDSQKKTYTLYANGEKIASESVSRFKPINKILGANSYVLGGVIRSGKLDFNFEGEIQSFKIYNELLTENELINATTNALTNKMIFKAGDATKANYFRIPALYTLSNKRVLASADARYGGTHDSPSKINITTSYSDDNGMTWSHPKLALEFEDYAKQTIDWPRDKVGKEEQISGSASFIDSALVEDKKTNKVILMSDFMPAGIGNSNALKDDSGFKKIDEQLYLKLKYEYESSYNYSIRENGVIYNDNSNTPTEYSVDNYYNLKKEGKYLTIEQYSIKFDNKELVEYKNGNTVKMNIFYKDALFKITPTNFIGYTTSSDSGETWEAPLLLPPFLGIGHNASYLSPGQGLIATKNNRIIFSSYSDKQMVFIISDDNGDTWESRKAPLPFSNATAEAQMVEIKPGVIQTYMRTTTGKIGYMTSLDNGDTWDEVKYLDIVENTSYGTQLSVIKYSQLINGKSAVILSTPNSTKGRRHGQIWLGYINENDNIIDWNNEYDIDYPRYGYSYSALTELSNHKIGLLYEKYDSWSREELHLKNILKFTTLTITNITNNSTI